MSLVWLVKQNYDYTNVYNTRKSGYNMYRGWTQRDYQNKHYNINQKDEVTLDDQGRDGGTNFILRIKEQETRLTFQEHDDDDDECICACINTYF